MVQLGLVSRHLSLFTCWQTHTLYRIQLVRKMSGKGQTFILLFVFTMFGSHVWRDGMQSLSSVFHQCPQTPQFLQCGWNLALIFHPIHQIDGFPDDPSYDIFILDLWKRRPSQVVMLLCCRSMTADFMSFHLWFTRPTLQPLPHTALTESSKCCHNISFLFSITPFWKLFFLYFF